MTTRAMIDTHGEQIVASLDVYTSYGKAHRANEPIDGFLAPMMNGMTAVTKALQAITRELTKPHREDTMPNILDLGRLLVGDPTMSDEEYLLQAEHRTGSNSWTWDQLTKSFDEC